MQTSAAIINNVKAYSVVRISEKNLKDLAILHSVVYGSVPEGYYQKKYNTAYTGVEHVGFIAYNNEVPIAYYGVIPCFIDFEGKSMLAAQSADTMTHPKYRLKGMFMELSNKTFELCRELGIQLVFGFPNQNSYHGALRLGWKETEKMDCFMIPVNTLPLKSISKRNFLLDKIYGRYSQAFLRKYTTKLNGLPNSVLQDGFAGVTRNFEYFKYKTYSNTKVIAVGDANLWINLNNTFNIGDMQGVREDNFKQVMKTVQGIARNLGLRQIHFHSSPGTSLHKLFSGSYRVSPSFPVLFQDFNSSIALEKVKFSFADIDIF